MPTLIKKIRTSYGVGNRNKLSALNLYPILNNNMMVMSTIFVEHAQILTLFILRIPSKYVILIMCSSWSRGGLSWQKDMSMIQSS